jgi:uncharacterized protein
MRRESLLRSVSLFTTAIGVLAASFLIHAAPPTVEAAARSGDKAAVRDLLQHGANVDAASADGMTALHWVAERGDADIATMLVRAGANVDATTRLGGYTPLLLAAKDGHAPVVELLLQAGADANAPTTTGTTPLMFASASGVVDAVTRLLDYGADADARESSRGETALDFAAAAGRDQAIRALTARGADVAVTTKVVDLAAYSAEPDESNGGVAAQGGGRRGRGANQKPGVERRFMLNELVGRQGGLTAMLIAARQGHDASVRALLDAGADINQPSAGDRTTPLLIAIINGRYDLARFMLDHGADARASSANGVTPLYAVLNCQWSPRSLYPQPRAYEQQHTGYLDLITALVDRGADVNARLKQKVWYSGYNTDFSGVDEQGATPFWRAAYASDVDAMKLLVARGADPNLPTVRTPGRNRASGDDVKEVSTLPPVPVGGPGVTALQAAAGVGYGEGFAGNEHRFAPGGMLAAVKYLVEELHMDVNAVDHDGNTALHHAAARGDNEMILYLVSKGADVRVVNRDGKTTADMANGPVQRVSPFPETIALLEKLGAKNNHRCISC